MPLAQKHCAEENRGSHMGIYGRIKFSQTTVAAPIAIAEACRYPGIKLSAVTTRKESQRGPHEYLRMTRAHLILAKERQRDPTSRCG